MNILDVLKTPVISLEGERLEYYLNALIGSLDAIRLDDSYPDKHLIAELLRFFSPEKHHGIYSALEIDAESGFPTRRELRRLETDKKMADENLSHTRPLEEIISRAKEKIFNFSEEEAERLREGGKELADHLREEQASYRRYDYYTKIKGAKLPEIFAVKFGEYSTLNPDSFGEYSALNPDSNGEKAKKVKGKIMIGYMVLNGFDATKNLFVRYQIGFQCGQGRFPMLAKYKISFDNGKPVLSRNFIDLLQNLFFLDAKTFYEALSKEVKDIDIYGVTRAMIGPFYFSETKKENGFEKLDSNSRAIKELVDRNHGSFVFSFPFDSYSKEAALIETGKFEHSVPAQFKFIIPMTYACSPNISAELRGIVGSNAQIYKV